MDETASYCTASPERNTVYTPVNRNIDECYTQVMGQYPLVLNDGSPFQYDDEASLDHHMRQMAASNFQAAKFGYDMSQLQSPMAKPFEPPSYKGIYTFEWPANKAQPIQGVDDSWAASTRFLKLTNNGPPASTAALYGYLHDLGDIQDFNTTRLKTEGVFLVSFFDLRAAIAAFTKVKTEQQHWNIQYCSQAYYMLLGNDDNISNSVMAEIVCSILSGPRRSDVPAILYRSLQDFGPIRKFTAFRNMGLRTFLVSFENHQTASHLVEILDGQYLMGFHLKVSIFEGEPFHGAPAPTQYTTSSESVASPQTGHDIWSPHPIHPQFDPSFSSSMHPPYIGSDSPGFESEPSTNQMMFSPRSYEDIGHDAQMHKFSLEKAKWDFQAHERLQVAENSAQNSPSRSPFRSASERTISKDSPTGSIAEKTTAHNAVNVPGKNIIDLERIARGLDTRTTVMLRNIPNKVDQETLKSYIDETSRGLYNFLYLRIDFRNICNVGYAFINFLDPLDIIDFVKAKSGTRWNKFNSEKVLDVTYANIQGIDQLVEKFRNSSVMDQDPAYRPKLFHSSGPLAGTEMEFPPANNILKKCRSISAAQQIGLFAPKLSAASKGVWRKRE